MKHGTWRAAAIFGILALCASPDAAEPTGEEVQAYLKKISQWHSKLHASGVEFGRALTPALGGKAVDVIVLNKRYRDLVKVIVHVTKETNAYKVPDHPAVKALAAANASFMEFQLDALADVMPGFLDVVEDATLDADAKSQRIQEILTKGNEREKAEGSRVREAIAEVRRVFKITEKK